MPRLESDSVRSEPQTHALIGDTKLAVQCLDEPDVCFIRPVEDDCVRFSSLQAPLPLALRNPLYSLSDLLNRLSCRTLAYHRLPLL